LNSDRSQQTKSFYEKSQIASPIVSTDARLIPLVVDAHEHRDVAVADVITAYLNANMNDYTLLKFTGDSVDIMCKMNPKYEEYFITESGRMVLYVQVLKALYECVVCLLLYGMTIFGIFERDGIQNQHS